MVYYKGASGVGIPDSNKVVISTSIDIIVGGLVVGTIESFNVSTSRPVQRIRELRSEKPGQVLEMVPSPADSNINVTGFMVYDAGKQHLFQRISGADGQSYIDLQSQNTPFDIVEKYTHPGTNTEYEVIYKGCWLDNYSKTQNIGTAAVSETASIQVSAIISDPV